MGKRVLTLLWLVLGVAVWCGFFDLYVARGADQYLRLQAEYELHLVQRAPSMTEMLSQAERHGAIVASIWAVLVAVCGWGTIWLPVGRARRPSQDP